MNADRARTLAAVFAGVSLALSLGLIAWQLWERLFVVPVPPPPVLGVVTFGNVTALILVLLLCPPRWPWTVTALTLAAAVALPSAAYAVHGAPESLGASTAAVSALMASAVAVAVAGARAVGPRSLRLIGMAVGTVVVWASLALGGAAAAGAPFAASYLRNEREWLGIWQLRGVMGHPNDLGTVAALVLLLQLLWVWAEHRRSRSGLRVTVLTVVGPVATLTVLLWSQSRTAWVAAAAALVLVIPWRRDARGLWAALVLVLAAALAVVPPVLGAWGMTFNGRQFAWSLAAEALARDPMVGAGPWLFSPQYWEQATGLPEGYWQPAHAHNMLLHAGTLLGTIGITVVVLAAVLAAVIAVTTRVRTHGLGLAALVVVGTLAGVEPALGAGSDVGSYLPVLLFALILGACHPSRRRSRRPGAITATGTGRPASPARRGATAPTGATAAGATVASSREHSPG